MAIQELKDKLAFVADDSKPKTVFVYVVPSDGSIKLLRIQDNLTASYSSMYTMSIRTFLDTPGLEIQDYTKADRRDNCIYRYDLAEKSVEMQRMEQVSNGGKYDDFSTKTYKVADIESLMIRLTDGNETVVLYKKVSSVEKILANYKILSIMKDSDRFDEVKDDMLRLTPSFMMMYVDNEVVMTDAKSVKEYLDLGTIIANEAKNHITTLEGTNMVYNVEELRKYILSDSSLGKRFIGAMETSPLIKNNIPAERIIAFSKTNSKLTGKFKYNKSGTKFLFKSKEQVKRFIQLLNDDFLRSELTNAEYEALAKN